MPTLFISHSSTDNVAAADIVERLRRQGFDSLFLDFDPADGIPAGRNWEQELYRQLNRSNAVVLLCSPASMTSDWCFAEITLARSMGKHLFPVVVEPCELRPILRDIQYVDLTGDTQGGLDRLWHGLRAAGLDPARSLVWDAARPPFPGLRAFQSEDAGVFFGRDDEVRQNLDTLEQMRRFGSDRLLLIIGASGSGKSSVVRAGMVPQLRRMPSWLVVDPFQPRRVPRGELALAVRRTVESLGGSGDREALRDGFEGPGAARALVDVVHWLRQFSGRAEATVLLVIDQLEELATLSDDQASAAFVALLKEAVDAAEGQLMCLATLRSDYLGEVQSLGFGRELPFRQQILAAMSPERFPEVIAKPAEMAHIEVESALVAQLARDARGTDALPLLAFTLHRLWRDFAEDGRLTLTEYTDRVGGIEGSIQQAVYDVLAAFDLSPEQRVQLRRAFTRMARVSEEGLYARRPAAWRDVPAAVHPVLEGFVEARLLVSGHVEQPELPLGENGAARDTRVLEVAHDALFRAWDELREWLQQDREFLLWRQRIERARVAWLTQPADEGLLLRGGPLAEAERWVREKAEEVDAPSLEFIRASRARARRSAWTRRGVIAFIVFALVGAAVFARISVDQRQQAKANRIESYWNLALAARDGEGDSLKAAHYLVAVGDLADETVEREDALVGVGLLSSGVELESAFRLPAVVAGLRADPDAALAVTWHRDGEARLWDLRSGLTLASMKQDGIDDARLLAGKRIVSRGEADVLLWGLGMDEPLSLARDLKPAGLATDLARTRLLAWYEDQTAVIWFVETGEAISQLADAGTVVGARFLEQGARLLTWSADARVRIWDPVSGDRLAEWEAGCVPQGVAMDDEETRLLVWCEDRLSMHKITPPGRQGRWQVPASIDGAALSAATGTFVAWSLGAGRIWRWNMDDDGESTPRELDAGGAVYRVRITPDGRKLVTAGADGWITVWDIDSGLQLARAQHGLRSGAGLRLEISPDGLRVLSWEGISGARLWDTGTAMALGLPMRHSDELVGATFIEKGNGVLTWSDGEVRVWRRHPGAELTAPWAVLELPRDDAGLGTRASMESDNEVFGPSVAGLDGYAAMGRTNTARLMARGTVARVLRGTGEDLTVSPPLYLGERILGGVLDPGSSRILLWGPATLRLWDSTRGRPLSAVLRSDVLFPEVGAVEGGLVTQDRDWGQARIWRWGVPGIPAGTPATAWLEIINGTALTEHGGVVVLSIADWCRAVGQQGNYRLPPSCPGAARGGAGKE